MKPILYALGSLSFAGQLFADDEAAEIAQAGTLYKKNCMGCHQPPDLRFDTDRAWVGQLMETA